MFIFKFFHYEKLQTQTKVENGIITLSYTHHPRFNTFKALVTFASLASFFSFYSFVSFSLFRILKQSKASCLIYSVYFKVSCSIKCSIVRKLYIFYWISITYWNTALFKGIVVNCMCQIERATGCPAAWLNIILDVPGRVFWDEINICIGTLSKIDCPFSCGCGSSNR